MLATAGPTSAARLGDSTSRSSGGSKARPAVSTRPTSRLATSAPRIEPMPPITMTTRAGIKMLSPMPTCTAVMGATSAPAKAARAAPMANTRANTLRTRTPIHSAMARLEAPARTHMPSLVWLTSRYRASAAPRPAPRISRR